MSEPTKSWFSDLPAPKALVASLSVEELKLLMSDSKIRAGVDFVVVDVRRADMDEPGQNVMIAQAINLPAQTFYQSLPSLFPALSQIPKVIFHCSSSRGRGPRCAGWYQDSLETYKRNESSRAYILTGGIKAWMQTYPEDVIKL